MMQEISRDQQTTPPGDAEADRNAAPICIELSSAQISAILQGVRDSGAISALFSGLTEVRATVAAKSTQLDSHHFSRSLLAGLLILAVLPTDRRYIGNAEIARLAGMSPSTTHRYLATLVEVGLLERDARTRRYRLTERTVPGVNESVGEPLQMTAVANYVF